MRNPNWTAREDATAAIMRRQGASNSEIGERLGRTAGAVKRRMTWMRLTPEERSEIGRTRTRNRDAEARV